MYGTGLQRDLEDTRDKKYDHLSLAASLFDWSVGFDIEQDLGITLPVKNQNGSYSCVGQATSTLAYVKNAQELKNVYRERLPEFLEELSAKSVYSQISLGFMAGARLRDGVKLIKTYGINTEKEVPSYSNGNPPDETFILGKEWQTQTSIDSAKNLQSAEYRVIQSSQIDVVAQAIRDNGGCLIGFDGNNNSGWSGKYPVPPQTVEWGHAMYAGKCKLINGHKFIGCLNSWGEGVGEKGWQWFGEEWFTSGHTMNPWVLVDKANLKWVNMIDNNGEARKFPTYFLKTIRYMEKLGFRLVK